MPGKDKRRFGRLMVSLDVAYTLAAPGAGRTFQGQGVTRDIGLSGLYFHTDCLPCHQAGQVLDLVITLPLSYLEQHGTSHLRVQGLVVRLESRRQGFGGVGVALRYLDYPCFSGPPSLD